MKNSKGNQKESQNQKSLKEIQMELNEMQISKSSSSKSNYQYPNWIKKFDKSDKIIKDIRERYIRNFIKSYFGFRLIEEEDRKMNFLSLYFSIASYLFNCNMDSIASSIINNISFSNKLGKEKISKEDIKKEINSHLQNPNFRLFSIENYLSLSMEDFKDILRFSNLDNHLK